MTNQITELVVPPGESGGTPIVINLRELIHAESRQNELAHASHETAQELSVEFNRQWLELNKLYTLITSEKLKADVQLAEREAVIQLDLMKAKLTEKGVSSTADTRKAVILTDEIYKGLAKTCQQIIVALEFIKGKMKGMENNFAVAKRLISDDKYMKTRPNPNIQASTYSSNNSNRNGFGKAEVR